MAIRLYYLKRNRASTFLPSCFDLLGMNKGLVGLIPEGGCKGKSAEARLVIFQKKSELKCFGVALYQTMSSGLLLC